MLLVVTFAACAACAGARRARPELPGREAGDRSRCHHAVDRAQCVSDGGHQRRGASGGDRRRRQRAGRVALRGAARPGNPGEPRVQAAFRQPGQDFAPIPGFLSSTVDQDDHKVRPPHPAEDEQARGRDRGVGGARQQAHAGDRRRQGRDPLGLQAVRRRLRGAADGGARGATPDLDPEVGIDGAGQRDRHLSRSGWIVQQRRLQQGVLLLQVPRCRRGEPLGGRTGPAHAQPRERDESDLLERLQRLALGQRRTVRAARRSPRRRTRSWTRSTSASSWCRSKGRPGSADLDARTAGMWAARPRTRTGRVTLALRVASGSPQALDLEHRLLRPDRGPQPRPEGRDRQRDGARPHRRPTAAPATTPRSNPTRTHWSRGARAAIPFDERYGALIAAHAPPGTPFSDPEPSGLREQPSPAGHRCG